MLNSSAFVKQQLQSGLLLQQVEVSLTDFGNTLEVFVTKMVDVLLGVRWRSFDESCQPLS